MSRGRFYVRLESREWPLLKDLAGRPPFDGAIISDRYLAARPEGHRDEDEPDDRLALSVLNVDRPFFVDPDTARLQQANTEVRQSHRDASRPLATALGVPLTVASFVSSEAVVAFVGAAAMSQTRAAAFCAPYLEVAAPDDPRLEVNVQLLRAARDVADRRPVIGFLQFLRRPLLDGRALASGMRMAELADSIVIRARALDPQDVTVKQAEALTVLVDRLSRKARVVVDCAGVAGPPLVAAGADAFSAGTRFFHGVAADLHPTTGGGGGEPLAAHATLASGGHAKAPVPAGEDPTEDNARLRLWNLQQMYEAAHEAGAQGLAYAAVLAASGDPQGQLWASALRRLAQRAA